MGHNLNPFNPKHDLEKALDPAGSAIRVYTGNPTTGRTVLDPGNAVWPKAADPVNYGNPSSFQRPAVNGPWIDPKTNMRAGASPGTPMATSIGSLGGKNQFPMPNPQVPQTIGSGPRMTIQPVQMGQRAV